MNKHRGDNLKDLLDEFHYLEAIDRINIIIDTIDRHLIQHQVCKINKDVSRHIEAAQSSLSEAHQLASANKLKINQ